MTVRKMFGLFIPSGPFERGLVILSAALGGAAHFCRAQMFDARFGVDGILTERGTNKSTEYRMREVVHQQHRGLISPFLLTRKPVASGGAFFNLSQCLIVVCTEEFHSCDNVTIAIGP